MHWFARPLAVARRQPEWLRSLTDERGKQAGRSRVTAILGHLNLNNWPPVTGARTLQRQHRGRLAIEYRSAGSAKPMPSPRSLPNCATISARFPGLSMAPVSSKIV